MNNHKFAQSLIEQIPENKMYYIIAYLQRSAVPEEIPNAKTLESFTELMETRTISKRYNLFHIIYRLMTLNYHM